MYRATEDDVGGSNVNDGNGKTLEEKEEDDIADDNNYDDDDDNDGDDKENKGDNIVTLVITYIEWTATPFQNT